MSNSTSKVAPYQKYKVEMYFKIDDRDSVLDIVNQYLDEYYEDDEICFALRGNKLTVSIFYLKALQKI